MENIVVLAQSGGGAALSGLIAQIVLLSVLSIAIAVLLFYILQDLSDRIRENHSSIRDLRDEIRDGDRNLRNEIRNGDNSLRSEIRNGDRNLRNEMWDGDNSLRSEIRDGLRSVRGEIKKVERTR